MIFFLMKAFLHFFLKDTAKHFFVRQLSKGRAVGNFCRSKRRDVNPVG